LAGEYHIYSTTLVRPSTPIDASANSSNASTRTEREHFAARILLLSEICRFTIKKIDFT